MPGPLHCDSISRAPLLANLRGDFAEFLNNTSLAHLRILSLTTCVRSRYGPLILFARNFSRDMVSTPSLLDRSFTPHHAFAFQCADLPTHKLPRLDQLFQQLAHLTLSVIPSHMSGYRNINLLDIDYASRPRLSSRLTLGGRPFPRKP